MKQLLYLFFLGALAFGCSKPSHWAFDQIHSDKEEHRSTKITYRTKDTARSIHLELIQTSQHLSAYLLLHSLPVTPHKQDPKKVLLTYEITGKKDQVLIDRFEGGQRLRLPDELTQTLINALQKNQEIILSLPGYRSTLKAGDFNAKYEKLLHPFPFQIPFKILK